jgi:hypothetical protein
MSLPQSKNQRQKAEIASKRGKGLGNSCKSQFSQLVLERTTITFDVAASIRALGWVILVLIASSNGKDFAKTAESLVVQAFQK